MPGEQLHVGNILEIFDNIPANLIWNSVGFSSRDRAYSFQILFKTAGDIVPTPSLKTRLIFLTSGMLWTASAGTCTVLKVSENACPILAAHLAGDLICEKSPSLLITNLA
jgi:hypothetical protein